MNSHTFFDDVANMMNQIGNTITETVIDVVHELNDTIPQQFNSVFQNINQQKPKLDINEKNFRIYIRAEKMSENLKNELGYKVPICSICLDNIENGEICRITQCEHIFHNECAKKWFLGTNKEHTCPMCRVKCF